VSVELADSLFPAKADPNQLEMALLNLAVNARDAMPDGGALRISVNEETVGSGHRAKLPSGRYLCVSHYSIFKDFAGPVATVVAALTTLVVASYFSRQQAKTAKQQAETPTD
jgi:signal transduction histidine kinase